MADEFEVNQGSIKAIKLIPIEGIPLVKPCDDLPGIIIKSTNSSKIEWFEGDILVIAQKIISKAEGRLVNLKQIEPSKRAIELGSVTEKDPRLVELILQESTKVIRYRKGVLVVQNDHGIILANAGIDRSNLEQDQEQDWVLLLPKDPDLSAKKIHQELLAKTGLHLGVIINDSIGRAWRNGTIGTAIGVAGLPAIVDLRGRKDLFGNPLRVSEEAVADELASAASLIQGQADEALPVVLIQGFQSLTANIPASGLIRPQETDLFQ
ncbi:MAG: coenzyme F420-0:L-glutamate ligase [SAR324 cluster bacterium]|nr:coenzyme F420-0:L-glutamate ligase [SAR324 cluster bacterium]